MTDVASMTYNDQRNLIESAISDSLDMPADGHPLDVWVVDMTDEWAVYQVDWSGELLQVTYTVGDNDQIALGKPTPVATTTSYEALPEGKAPVRRHEQRRQRPAALDGVKREPLTYERHAPRSYFRDVILFKTGGDNQARANLDRHAMEQRVNPNVTDGQGGYFAPPGYLIEHFQTARRPDRVLANLVKAAGGWFPMPAGVKSINIPLLATGDTDTEVDDLDPDNDQDIVDVLKTSPVATLSGQADVSLQALEQSPPTAALDWAIFKDLTSSYDADLNQQMFYGLLATPGQFAGIATVVSTSNAVAYTSGSPVFTGMYPIIGQAFAQVGDNRLLPPEVWLMRSARWAWIGTSEDSSLRPIVPPELAPPPEPAGDGTPPVASMLGLPVYLSDSVSAKLGSTANQDEIIACRPSDLLLFEGTPHEAVMTDVLSGTLSARIQLRNYVAFVIGHVSSIATVTGTGMVVQSGF